MAQLCDRLCPCSIQESNMVEGIESTGMMLREETSEMIMNWVVMKFGLFL